jgi:O-antigen/teichoic acid export membrane protein
MPAMQRSFAGPVAGTFAAYLAGLAANLVVSILVARTMGPAGAGVIALALVGPNILALVGNLGLPNAISHFLGRRAMNSGRVFTVAGSLALVFGHVLLIAYVLSAPWVREVLVPGGAAAADDRFGLSPALMEMAAAVIVLEIILQCLMAIYQGLHRFGQRSFLMLAYRWLYVALAAAAVYSFGAEPWLIVAAGVAAYFLVCLVGLLMALRTVMLEPLVAPDRPWLADARRLLAYAWRTHVAAVILFIIMRADLFLVKALLTDDAQVGLYSRATQVAEVIFYFMLAAENVLFPRLSGLAPRDIPTAAAVLCRRALLAGAILVAAFELLSRWLILVPFGDEFEGSIAPLRILLPAVLAIGLARALFSVFNALERPWPPAILAALGLAAMLVLDFAWIPERGIEGAALASLVAYFLVALGAALWLANTARPAPKPEA